MPTVHGKQHPFRLCSWNNLNFMQWKIALSRSGLEPTTPRLHAECSNRWATGIWHFPICGLGYWLWRYKYFLWRLTYEMSTVCGKQHPSRLWTVVIETIEIRTTRTPAFWDTPRRPILVVHIRPQVQRRQSESYTFLKIDKNLNFARNFTHDTPSEVAWYDV